jgi:hypothetical protein
LLECQCAIETNAVAYAYTTSTKNTEVIVSIIKGIVLLNWKTSVIYRIGCFCKADLVDDFLDLTPGIIGTVPATGYYANLAYGAHELFTFIMLVAKQAACWMLAQKQFENLLPQSSDFSRVGSNYHACLYWGGT